MSDLSIHPIRENDIEFVYTSCKNESWNYSRKRIERVHHYEPKGCFVATVNKKRVGHVFSINYRKVGWIGLLIVNREHRRIGIGTLLVRRAIDYLQNLGVETVKLEAVPEIAGLYRKLGFIDEFDSLRFKKVNKKDNQSTNPNIKPLKENQITETAEFDSRHFGANRTRVLHQLFEDNPELCFISHRNSQIVGYIMCYKTETGYRIGPWICNPHHPQIAKGLILKCMQAIQTNEKLYVGVPAVNNASVKILQDLDFGLYCKSMRMYLGKKPANEHVEFIFSISGPENG